MKKIKLTQGKYALVDDEDFSYLNRFKWYVHLTKLPSGRAYARPVREVGRRLIFMDSLLVTVKNKGVIKHENYNGLDNQKKNLIGVSPTICTHQSKKCLSRNGKKLSSKYKGVTLRRDWKNKWAAKISKNYSTINLGFFDTQEEAALAYNKKAKELYGEYAYQNKIEY